MKLTKRMLSLALALLMMLSCIVFVGCEEFTSDELTDELKVEMQWYYIKQTEIPENDYHGERSYSDVLIEFFGGIYKGYAVVMIDAIRHQYEIAIEEIGGVEFKYFDTNRLVAYKNGEFISLQEAYEKNILSVSDLEKISEKFSSEKDAYYKVCDRYDFPDFCSLSRPDWIDYPDDIEYLYVSMWYSLEKVGEDIPASYFNQYLDKYFADTASGTSAIIDIEPYIHQGHRVLKLKLRNPLVYLEYMGRLMEVPGVYAVATDPSAWVYVDSDQVNVSSGSANNKWGLEDINVENVYQFIEIGYRVGIGVIDTGIYEHEYLANTLNIYESYDTRNSSVIATDDPKGHGTHVAGIIGAYSFDGDEVVGVNTNVNLYSLQTIDSGNNFSYEGVDIVNIPISKNALVAAINRANERNNASSNPPFRLLNYSIQGITEARSDLREAIANFNGLIICSAGNYAVNNDGAALYPQNYDLDNIIVVGALNENGDRYINSNYGANSVDIYAPGENIYSTLPNNTFGQLSGTSMAAPYVTGVASLLISMNRNITPIEVKNSILGGADIITITLPSGATQQVKKLNSVGALKYMFEHYYNSVYAIDDQISFRPSINEFGDDFVNSNFVAKLNIGKAGDYTFKISSSYDGDMYLYDNDLNLVASVSKESSNQSVEMKKYLTPGTYYFRIGGFYTNATSPNVSVKYEEHIHSYTDKYVRYSDKYHIGCCACGAKSGTKSPHVFMASQEDAGDRFYTCILCGGAVDVWMDGPGMIIHAIQKVSVNGSYILSDGTVFLVDEDIDAYFNGTLMFYNPDDLPQTK